MDLLIPPQLVFIDQNGAPLASGTVTTYIPGTTTPATTYLDADGNAANTNPIVLDIRGSCVAYSASDVRMVLKDANDNQIFDLVSTAPFPASSIGAIGACLGQPTLQGFLDCSGVTAAINTAVSNAAQVTGPAGPQGVTGPTGSTGPTGPTGSSGGSSGDGWALLGGDFGTAPLLQWGFGTSDSTGSADVTFPRAYSTAPASIVATCAINITGWWATINSHDANGFNCITGSPYVGGLWKGGPMGFFWMSLGI